MKREIDVNAVLAPLQGENPAGEDLRYTSVYEDIKEARREDDALERGAWQTELKKADWQKARTLAVEALTQKSKDLQIAAWLTEALVNTDGFEGLRTGLQVLTGLLREFWDHVYPVVEEGDLEFRAGPLEFLNERLAQGIRQIAMTDPKTTAGYPWLKWQESRQVGCEKDTRNQWGDVDESKKAKRDEMIAEGRLAAEDFDAAVALSSKAFYEALAAQIRACREEFTHLDETVDSRFGAQHAPRLSDLGEGLDECERLAMRFLKEKGGAAPAEEGKAEAVPAEAHPEGETAGEPEQALPEVGAVPSVAARVFEVREHRDGDSYEQELWSDAVRTMKTSGITTALAGLLDACYRAPSVRERNRRRLLVAKLCLKADRPDLARPIIEELYALLEELHLDRWESPQWIAEVIDTLYQCLTKGEPTDDDVSRSRTLFQRLCSTDVTKAVLYRK